MGLHLYNTFTKREEEFVPLDAERTLRRAQGDERKPLVTMYTCGPTVYGRPHIGNYSSFLMADLLRRWLEVSGYSVKHVKNITDVGHLVSDQDRGEDKVEKEARRIAKEQGRAEITHDDVISVARMYEAQYLEDEQALHFLEPFARPRASETIPEMIALIQDLLRKGHAYESDDGIYYSVTTFPSYGALSGNTLEKLSAGARIDVREQKRHPADFALWKKCVGENAKHVLRWASPWGEGFPGWHIECSAMSTKYLGAEIDIHTGGEDNIFPHHECEIAQSEGASGHTFVRMWLHRRRIDIGSTSSPQGGEKMSKSLGNVISLPDIVAMGFSPADLRYYLLSVHYRTNLKFTEKGLSDAHIARRSIMEWMGQVEGQVRPVGQVGQECWMKFEDALNADLNTPAALAVVFNVMSASRKEGELGAYKNFVTKLRSTFGCFEPETSKIPEDVTTLLSERERARASKDFATSDQIRRRIRERGYEVRDTDAGQRVDPL